MKTPGQWDSDDVWACLALLVLVSIIGVGVWAIVACIRADGRVDHCYVERRLELLPTFVAVGHRPWRLDIDIAVESTSDQAQEKLRAMCPAGSR